MRPLRISVLAATLGLSACGTQSGQAPVDAPQAHVLRPAAFQNNDGSDFVEFMIPCEHPEDGIGPMSVGPDGNLWYVRARSCDRKLDGRGSVGVVNVQTNAATEYVIPVRLATPVAIAQNGGYLWVADSALYHSQGRADDYRPLYRVDTSGNFEVGGPPGGDMLVSQMAQGPDGNLWFAGMIGRQAGKPAVGVETPAGSAILYALKLPKYKGSVPTSIAAGADNNLWVTTREYGAILQVVPATGAQTFFHVGGAPLWMTAAQHVLIYSDRYAAQLSVMTLKGVATVYPAPQGVRPVYVTSKPDGSVFFTDAQTGKIGTFDPSTGAYGPELEAPDGVSYLANAADGNLWFASGFDVGAYLKYVLTTSPASIAFAASQCAPVTLTASETNYNGSFTAVSANPQVATVTPLGGTTFSIAPAGAGSTTIGVADGMRNAVAVPVTVQGC